MSHTSTASDTRYWRLENVEDEIWHSIYVPLSSFPPFSSPSAGARADVREQRGRVHSPLRAAVRNDPQLHPHQALMQYYVTIRSYDMQSIYDARLLYRTYEHQLCLPTRKGFSLSKRFPEIYLRAPHGMVAAMRSCLGEIC